MKTRKIWPLPFAAAWVASTLAAPAVFADTQIGLEEAVSRAIQHSPFVTQAESEWQAQTEHKRAAWTNLGPKASVSYTEAGTSLQDRPNKTGTFSVVQPITGLYAGIEYSRLNGIQAEIAGEGFKKARRDAGFGAAESFLQAYQAREQQIIAEASIAAAKSAYQDALVLQRVGRISQSDVLKFQIALSGAEFKSAQAKAAKEIAFLSLKQAVQVPTEENLSLTGELPSLPTSEPQAAQPQDLKPRSELRQAELAAEAAGFGKKLVYAKLVPNVNLFAKWDRNFSENLATTQAKDTKSYGVSVQWDIWSNGSSAFELREAIAQEDKAAATLQVAKDAIQLDLKRAFESYQAAQESRRLAQDTVAQAEEAYRIDQLRFKNGQISATELIKSESDRSDAKGRFVSISTEVLLWYFRLQKATGQEKPALFASQP